MGDFFIEGSTYLQSIRPSSPFYIFLTFKNRVNSMHGRRQQAILLYVFLHLLTK